MPLSTYATEGAVGERKAPTVVNPCQSCGGTRYVGEYFSHPAGLFTTRDHDAKFRKPTCDIADSGHYLNINKFHKNNKIK